MEGFLSLFFNKLNEPETWLTFTGRGWDKILNPVPWKKSINTHVLGKDSTPMTALGFHPMLGNYGPAGLPGKTTGASPFQRNPFLI